MYKKTITAAKTLEAPIIIIPIAEAASAILEANGINIPSDKIYMVIIALYGAGKGLINWIKNRKK